MTPTREGHLEMRRRDFLVGVAAAPLVTNMVAQKTDAPATIHSFIGNEGRAFPATGDITRRLGDPPGMWIYNGREWLGVDLL